MRSPGAREVAGRWVRATVVGWLLGVPFVIPLALAGETVGIGGAQSLVGAGMGTGVGLMQARVIRAVLPEPARWFWSCAIGLSVPFFVVDLARVLGHELPYLLYVAVAVGGLVVGAWQALVLRLRVHNAGWWVVGSVVGWTLASGAVAAADHLTRSHSVRGVWGALVYLSVVASVGLVLGVVTGISLVWLLRNTAVMGHR
jgi:hypothetical protein